ncbi:hypothetical protein QQX09_00530 [Demequina sp. SYSU T00192]|uniref:Uncharacterized protein n=1 Tax=Demequina litoralis TaxID=3051660 RepID=A0ABT8G5C8_9MICO|nr:hypothetical protein [Demequina sp. SYSU T00192]MDN4474332.1 hypothetical protein [Demequina sp. SYSU T00192]
MKRATTRLQRLWRTANSWEFWAAPASGLVAALVLLAGDWEIRAVSGIATWSFGVGVSLSIAVATLWKNTTDLIRSEPVGEIVRARDSDMDEVHDVFVVVHVYLAALVLWGLAGVMGGDLLKAPWVEIFLSLGVWLGFLGFAGFASALGHWWRFQRWNSRLLAIRDQGAREARLRRNPH